MANIAVESVMDSHWMREIVILLGIVHPLPIFLVHVKTISLFSQDFGNTYLKANTI